MHLARRPSSGQATQGAVRGVAAHPGWIGRSLLRAREAAQPQLRHHDRKQQV